VKLLFVHEVNWSEKPIFEIHDYPELLSLRGHQVAFIDFPEYSKPKEFSHFLDRFTTREQVASRAHSNSSVEILTPGKICRAPFDRLLHSITFVPLLTCLLRRRYFDAIVLYGVPTNGWQTVLLSKFLRTPVLFRAIDVSHVLRKTSFAPLIRLAEKFVYRFSDWISANNQVLAEYCIANGADSSRVSVDYPGLDLERFQPSERDSSLQRARRLDPDDKVVVFMGTLYRFSGISKFLHLFSEELRKDQRIKVLILGDGEEKAKIEELVASLKIAEQVLLTGFVSYGELPNYLKLADVAINPFENQLVTNGALPWKVVQYLACGIPTVSTPLEGLTAFTGKKSDNGIVYSELSADFVAEVANLLSDPERRKRMSQQARRFVELKNNWSNCIVEFETRISNLTQSK